ncbi:hypothetical protein [Luteimonas changyuni]|uniref:hypothetical protein n=1 Tax=Luteimonas sp. MJ145 TaxID=3129234 RepID=UPI0031BB8155
MTAAELADVDARLRSAQREVARDRDAALAMTPDQRRQQAAEIAARKLLAEAEKKRERVVLQVLAAERIENHLAGFDKKLEGLDRLLAFMPDGRTGTVTVESQARAIRQEAVGRMSDTIDVLKGRFLGLLNDPAANLALVREIFGQSGGDPTARTAAKAWRDVTESLRQRYNAAGGDVGYRADWHMPRDHAAALVAKNREGWIEDHMRWVDREQYANPDGTLMDDAQLREFLTHASLTIITNGTNKIDPGQFRGSGMRANHGNEARQIHYRDAEAFIEAQQAYGGKSLLDLMVGHVDGISRDIALIETFGPNSDLAYRTAADRAQQADDVRDPLQAEANAKERRRMDRLYEEVASLHEPPASAAIANGFDTYRALNVAARLGSSVITALTDHGPVGITAHLNGMPVLKVFGNELRQLNPLNAEHRRLAQRAGLGINQMIGSLNRWGADGLGTSSTVSGKLAKWSQGAAARVMQASGMNALTMGQQRAFTATYMDTLGDLSRRYASLDDMQAPDAKRLRSQGVTDADWDVWKLAQPEDWRGTGDTVLTAASIRDIPDAQLEAIAAARGVTVQQVKDRASTTLMAVVLDEGQMAVIEPAARERSMMYGTFERGTWGGEIARSFWQFKGFPITMMTRHFRRGMAMQTGAGKVGYLGTMMATTTVLGAMAYQLNEIVSGKDPMDMSDPKFWGAAFLKGGSLGLYGDFLFADTSRGGSSPLAAIGGPIAGDLEALFKLKDDVNAGEANQAGGKAVRLVKSHTPFANLWYTKATTDHLFFHQLQEQFSPGYLRRMRQRARRENGQEWWWEPGQPLPERAPDLEAAMGE